MQSKHRLEPNLRCLPLIHAHISLPVRLHGQAEAEMNALNRKLQQIVEDLEKSEEKTKIAITKMEQATGEADESER